MFEYYLHKQEEAMVAIGQRIENGEPVSNIDKREYYRFRERTLHGQLLALHNKGATNPETINFLEQSLASIREQLDKVNAEMAEAETTGIGTIGESQLHDTHRPGR